LVGAQTVLRRRLMIALERAGSPHILGLTLTSCWKPFAGT
jgi:hypothetical protein